MPRHRLLLLYSLLFLGFLGYSAKLHAADFARVERLHGEAWIEKAGPRQMLSVASMVARDDQVRTGPNSRLLLTLADGGNLTLGENASLRATSVLEASSRSLTRVDLKGAFRMVSSAAQPHRKQEWVIGTPVAMIGIRGTDFFAGPLDGALDVMVLSGLVEVSTEGGQVMLEPRQGTVVRNAAGAPSTPIIWEAAKVQRAFSMVDFPTP